MVSVFKRPLSAEDVKAKARELGADLVGIADGKAMDAHPPDPDDPRRPRDITDLDGGRVIVLARRLNAGVARIKGWGDRHKFYNDELALTALEEVSLALVYWLEDAGYPAIIVPPTHFDAWRYDGDPAAHEKTLLSLPHAAAEAGLGTLGLNLQLITPEFGPRVVLTAVLCSVDVTPDQRRADALCLGPSCGRCLAACPGDVVGQWARDWSACDTYRSPYGFRKLVGHLETISNADSPEARRALLRSEPSFNLWQSILRGSGVITGCRRCADVCPVGADYAELLQDAVDDIPERTPEKDARLVTMRAKPAGGDYARSERWIGKLDDAP